LFVIVGAVVHSTSAIGTAKTDRRYASKPYFGKNAAKRRRQQVNK